MLNFIIEQGELSSPDWKYNGIFHMNSAKLIFLSFYNVVTLDIYIHVLILISFQRAF